MKIEFTLNGKIVTSDIKPDMTLLELLRSCGCHSVRSGCDTGNCGICTVWINDIPTLSCAYPAPRINGKSVTTIEGVQEEASVIINALAEEGADQCGYCAPGFIMSVLALLRDKPNASEKEIDEYLAGNLCRCTGYVSQARALKKLFGRRQ